MQRRVLDQLAAWKSDPLRKPLILRGARQVGKTWSLRAFGAAQYDQVVYVNFERDESVVRVFDGDLDADRIVAGLAIATRTTIHPGSTLIVLDEIQAAPRALTALKYLAEDRPDLHVAAAGSLLGIALRSAASFPVGKVDFLDLHPMDFDEFLRAVGEAPLAEAVDAEDWTLLASFRERLIDLLRRYLYVGGMPEVVARHADGGDVDAIRSVQLAILRGYEADFTKYADPAVSRRIAQVWGSLPTQLAREQKRFILSRVRDGARGREFEDALQWLADAGLVNPVTRCTKPASPARAYEDPRIFKLLMHDVGLLGALAGLDASVLLEGTGIFEEFKGALTEQYVAQEIVASTIVAPMYWSPEGGTAEVDFVLERGPELVPIEVKAAENTKSKSLRSYIDRYGPAHAMRFSLADHREQADLINLPLYAIGPWLRNG